MIAEQRRIGVVLFQLGGPENLDAIEPFLYNLFCDPEIIDFPGARYGRKALAKLISVARARKVQHHYARIGGGSPIRRYTEQQACALQTLLRKRGIDAYCFVAMRYWRPFTAEAVRGVQAVQCDELVLLPLYPQYSSTTTGSSLNEWNRHYSKPASESRRGWGAPNGARVHWVEHFYREKMYIGALVERVSEALARFHLLGADDPNLGHPKSLGETVHLVFSAHGVPVSVIERGDPYQRQIEETVALVMESGGWAHPYRLCYQSKVGSGRWLGPTLAATLRTLAGEGAQNVCVVPISFVSDHVETLGEIDHEARAMAGQLGISHFEMAAGLNDSPKFIEALAEIVLRCIRVSQGVEHTPASRITTKTCEASLQIASSPSVSHVEPRTLHGHL